MSGLNVLDYCFDFAIDLRLQILNIILYTIVQVRTIIHYICLPGIQYAHVLEAADEAGEPVVPLMLLLRECSAYFLLDVGELRRVNENGLPLYCSFLHE